MKANDAFAMHKQTGELKMEYVIVRSRDAGVLCGYLKERCRMTNIVVLEQARQIWKWEGAFTLVEMANEGIEEASRLSAKSLLPIEVAGVCTILRPSDKAKEILESLANG